jgi:hypothetical protein
LICYWLHSPRLPVGKIEMPMRYFHLIDSSSSRSKRENQYLNFSKEITHLSFLFTEGCANQFLIIRIWKGYGKWMLSPLLSSPNGYQHVRRETEVAWTSMLCWFFAGNKRSTLRDSFLSNIKKQSDSNHSRCKKFCWDRLFLNTHCTDDQLSLLQLSCNIHFEKCQMKRTLTIVEITPRFSSRVHWRGNVPRYHAPFD